MAKNGERYRWRADESNTRRKNDLLQRKHGTVQIMHSFRRIIIFTFIFHHFFSIFHSIIRMNKTQYRISFSKFSKMRSSSSIDNYWKPGQNTEQHCDRNANGVLQSGKYDSNWHHFFHQGARGADLFLQVNPSIWRKLRDQETHQQQIHNQFWNQFWMMK